MYELSDPWWLLLLFIPLIGIFLIKGVTIDYKAALRVPFYQVLTKKTTEKVTFNQYLWLGHWLIIWTLLVIALSGPRWVGLPIPVALDTHHVMMVLDISGSMGLEDMPSNRGLKSRWQVVRETAKEFVQKRQSDRLGLILFGERAYLFAPLTHDALTIQERIDDASVGLAGQATALGDAIGLGIKHLQVTPEKGRVMILLTDGVSNAGIISPLKAAELANKEHVKIYVIGLGPTNQQGLSGIFWQLQHSNDLDEDTLQKIAKTTNGQYFRATNQKSLNEIYQAIDTLEPVKHERLDLRPEKPYFYLPLGLALFWIIALFAKQIWLEWRSR